MLGRMLVEGVDITLGTHPISITDLADMSLLSQPLLTIGTPDGKFAGLVVINDEELACRICFQNYEPPLVLKIFLLRAFVIHSITIEDECNRVFGQLGNILVAQCQIAQARAAE